MRINNLKIGVLIVLIVGSCFGGNSQAIGLEGKRFNVDLKVGFGVTSTAYSLLFSKLRDEDKERGANSIYRFPALRLDASFNYTISRKSSIGVLFSNSTYKFKASDEFEPINDFSNGYYDYYFHVSNSVQRGIGFQYTYYLTDYIAPVGMSLSFYSNYHTVKVENLVYNSNSYSFSPSYGSEYYKDYAPSNYQVTFFSQDSVSFSMNYITIGMTFNNISFISNKIPLYVKYGIGIGGSIYKKYAFEGDDNFESSMYKHSKYYAFNSYNFNQFSSFYRTFELLKFNFGLGYIF